MAALTTVTETGFEAALIQRQDDIKPYLNTVFCVNLLRGAVLGVVLYVLSPMIAAAFDSPQTVKVLRSLIPVVLIEGVTNPAVVIIRRELQFRRIAIWECAEAIAAFISAIMLSLWLGNVFAIVLSLIAAQIARTIASYVLVPFMPQLELNWHRVRDLSHFGVWVMAANIAVFLLLYIDDVAVTLVLGTAALGLYQVAFRIANIPVTEMSHVVGRITYPAYAEVQSDSVALRGRWLRALRITSLIAIPGAAIIVVTAHDAVPLLLGVSWNAIIPVVQVLAVYGAVRALNAASGTVLNALGKPRSLAYVSGIQLIVVTIAIVPCVRMAGLIGAAWVVFAANSLALCLIVALVAGQVGSSVREVLFSARPAVLAAVAIAAPVMAVQAVVPSYWVPLQRLSATSLMLIVLGGSFVAWRVAFAGRVERLHS